MRRRIATCGGNVSISPPPFLKDLTARASCSREIDAERAFLLGVAVFQTLLVFTLLILPNFYRVTIYAEN